jgi:hypothetical protein
LLCALRMTSLALVALAAASAPAWLFNSLQPQRDARPLSRCELRATVHLDFRGDRRPYAVEERDCGGLYNLQKAIIVRDPSNLPIYVLSSREPDGLRSLSPLPLPGEAQALLIGMLASPDRPQYAVLAWSRGELRALAAPDLLAELPLAAGESLQRSWVVEAVAGGLLLDAPVFAEGDLGCCASRGRILMMLALEPGQGRLSVLGARREP